MLPECQRNTGYETVQARADCTADDRRYLLVEGMTRYTTSGVLGRPSLSSAEKGKAVMASLVQSFADLLHVLG